jgi:hypothetical protein
MQVQDPISFNPGFGIDEKTGFGVPDKHSGSATLVLLIYLKIAWILSRNMYLDLLGVGGGGGGSQFYVLLLAVSGLRHLFSADPASGA